MFERFTAPARRVLFWARAEAARLGSDWIEPEHFLLGVLAEDQREWERYSPPLPQQMMAMARATAASYEFFSGETSVKLRELLTASAGPSKTDVVDIPLARRSKQILADVGKRTAGGSITLLHILRGLMEDSAVGTTLASAGITLAQIDEAIQRNDKRLGGTI